MLFVSNNGHDFSSAPKSPTLIVRTAPLVYSIQPDLGPVSGGTRILISGRNLPPRGLNCQFGNHPPVSLEQISVGGTTAFCRSPKFDAPGKTDFDLLFHGSPIMQKNEKLSYLAHPAITVSKVMPEAAVRTGGTSDARASRPWSARRRRVTGASTILINWCRRPRATSP